MHLNMKKVNDSNIKIGIMTMHRVPNYGSFMQALSLKKIIENLGYKTFFVDFSICPDIDHRNDFLSNQLCKIKMYKKIIFGISFPHFHIFSKSKDKIFSNYDIYHFCDYMLGLTQQFHVRTKVNTLIIGSDEVFNCLQSGPNIGYSLELFGKNSRAKKLISYAASFGNTTIERLNYYGVTKEIGNLLDKFDALSVRDENSLHIVESISNKEALMHLDPVLISGVEKMPWREIPVIDRYLILYGYENRFTKPECEQVMDFAESMGLKVIALGEQQLLCDDHICCRPDEVLSYFKNAEYVITDTFHGTIFSVINHKKFVTITRPSINGAYGNEEKITSLMNTLSLQDRVIKSLSEINNVINNEIDYDAVDSIRIKERERSLNYLKENII